MAKFDTVFKEKQVQKVTHPSRRIEWIHYSKLVKNAYQFYSEEEEGIVLLAEMILADGGITQNLIIRKHDADSYEIVAGHRRTLAAKYISEELHMAGYELLPCIITTISEVKARFQVISSNQYRTKTSFEIMKEIEELKYLMSNYPEEFEPHTGRMVDRLAAQMGMKRTTVGEYLTISSNLGEQGREAFEKGTIEKSAAVALASLEEKEQEELIQANIVTHKEIKKLKENKKSYRNSVQEVKEEKTYRNSVQEVEEPETYRNSVQEMQEEETYRNLVQEVQEEETYRNPVHEMQDESNVRSGEVYSVYYQDQTGILQNKTYNRQELIELLEKTPYFLHSVRLM